MGDHLRTQNHSPEKLSKEMIMITAQHQIVSPNSQEEGLFRNGDDNTNRHRGTSESTTPISGDGKARVVDATGTPRQRGMSDAFINQNRMKMTILKP